MLKRAVVRNNFLMGIIHICKILANCQVDLHLIELVCFLVVNLLSPGGEMVYTLASGASALKERGGSTPLLGTKL